MCGRLAAHLCDLLFFVIVLLLSSDLTSAEYIKVLRSNNMCCNLQFAEHYVETSRHATTHTFSTSRFYSSSNPSRDPSLRMFTKLTAVTSMHPGDTQIEREIIEEREPFEELHKMDEEISSLITKKTIRRIVMEFFHIDLVPCGFGSQLSLPWGCLTGCTYFVLWAT